MVELLLNLGNYKGGGLSERSEHLKHPSPMLEHYMLCPVLMLQNLIKLLNNAL